MVKYIVKKICVAFLTIFILVSVVFLMIRLLPGDPFNDVKVPKATQEKMRSYYGLDKPLHEQYLTYMNNLLHGNMGYSLRTQNRTVNEIIVKAFPYSLDLGIRALIFAVVAGLGLGILAALKHNKFWDHFSMTIAVIGISVPSFIIGSLIQYVFAVKLKILPVALWETEASTILPTFALGLGSVASVARIMRTSMLEISNEDYIKTAKAKGLSNFEITRKHKLRNSLLPIVTVLGPMVAVLLTGTFVIENIFAIPGLGKHYVNSIQTLDYPLILGMTLVYSVFLIVMQLFVDIVYGLVDPRIKLYQ
ncbi:ABC transporter permease [Lacrimispora sp. NSJ-141]|uniref:ABC transporter permease n=2 Tax=Lachnospiraceae TaxID=186803 RepID=A0A7G9G4F5_9FIRM|nr:MULTISPECIES: ABC transporter permease [Lachnospiraceae]MCD2491162.1 ABC transporter permease [Lientehia hominis]QNM05687.1 ABC transporter permease [Qiania dongpingensis]